MSDSDRTLVIDAGTANFRSGTAGDEQPKITAPTVVARPRVSANLAFELKYYAGHNTDGLGDLRAPIDDGVVQSWDDMEVLWQYCMERFTTPANEACLLVTDSPRSTRADRAKMAEILLETMGLAAMFVSLDCTLALYAYGLTTGVVLSSGETRSYAVPIIEGVALRDAIVSTQIGGRHVTEALGTSLEWFACDRVAMGVLRERVTNARSYLSLLPSQLYSQVCACSLGSRDSTFLLIFAWSCQCIHILAVLYLKLVFQFSQALH